jgi:hypothetical protein
VFDPFPLQTMVSVGVGLGFIVAVVTGSSLQANNKKAAVAVSIKKDVVLFFIFFVLIGK